ncbi:recombinase family protein [Bradyrhizobium sp. RT10b]|uniref:recombinase family protein n=1 Tax=Bradyrhizobium sp. RT10b TaxID=3156331 RepID=UPI0033924226
MVQHHGKFVSYLRVSTKRQGESGLGLEAQRAAVDAFLNGGRWKLVEELVEVESGKHHHNRPALHKAMEACKVYGATLVIAKLDRLSRDAHFLLGLQKAGVKFVAADMPEANEMVVGIMALVAQAERRMISERTKAALQAVKARGKRLGRPKGYQIPSNLETRAKGSAANAANAVAFAERLRPVLTELASLSAAAAAAELDRRGVQTALGGKWTARAVINVRARLAD